MIQNWYKSSILIKTQNVSSHMRRSSNCCLAFNLTSTMYRYDGCSDDNTEHFFVNPKNEEDEMKIPEAKLGHLVHYLEGNSSVQLSVHYILITDDMQCRIKVLEDKIVGIELPTNVEVVVKTAPPHNKTAQIAAQYVVVIV